MLNLLFYIILVFKLIIIIIIVVMLTHIRKLFLVIVALSCLTCFQRADYNLPLFTFAYFLWDFQLPNVQKLRLFYLFLATWVVDFIWLIYWGITWSSDEYKQNGPSGPAMFVLVLSIISFLVKLGVIGIAYVFDPDIALAIKNFMPNLKSVYAYQPEPHFD